MFTGSLVAIVTPMRDDGGVDLAAWDTLLDWHAAEGTAGIVVGGTTGESATLTDDELQTLVRAAIARVGGRVRIIAGAGVPSTAATVERARWLSVLGVDGLLVVTPAYIKPTQEGLYRHYAAVAAASSVPIVLYNVPGRTGVDMLPATVGRLAAVPGIVALKEAVAGAARVRELRAAAPGITVLSGDDPTAREAILAGARGVISVTANVAPRLMAEMVAAALAGDAAQAAALDDRLAGLHQALFVEPNPIPSKWALARVGRMPGGIRLPLTPLTPAGEEPVLSAMRRAGIIPA
ncbi:MAG: 4-hydroxy-tetrahydrodipicolinate synthase [Gammaproteobacteria bacterium]